MGAQSADVVVIGAGIIGASAAWHLARAGAKVVLLEQFALDHRRGSSHGAARIFRLAYEQPDYIELGLAALPVWREIEATCLGRELLWSTGGIDVGPSPALSRLAHTLRATDTPFEEMSPAEVRRRFPWIRLPADWHAIYQRDAGILRADACRLGLVELARRAGAEVRERMRVERLILETDTITVECEGARWSADHVVVAGAGWSNRLLEPLGLSVPMRITREHVAYFPCDVAGAAVPFMCHHAGSGFDFYGLPNWRHAELKVGHHNAGPEVDPDDEPCVDEERIVELVEFVREHLPGCASLPVRTETCLYAATPDDDFVVDRVGRIVLGIGFGSHGFKFGGLMGRILADVVRGKSTPYAERFSLSRFSQISAS